MPTLQGDFAWDAALATAVPVVDLVFRCPASLFTTIPDSNGRVERSIAAAATAATATVAADAKTYGSVLDPARLTGSDTAAFVHYLIAQYGAIAAGRGDPIDVAVPVDVDLLSPDGALLDRVRLDALFFMKHLHETDENGLVNAEFLVSQHSPAGLTALVARDGFLVDRTAYEALLDRIAAAIAAEPTTGSPNTGSPNAGSMAYFHALLIVAYLVDLSGAAPALAATTAPADANFVQRIAYAMGSTNPDGIVKLVKDALPALFDFPLTTHGVHLQPVAGTIELRPSDAVVTTAADLALFDLALDYATTDVDGNAVETRAHFDWSAATAGGMANVWAFDFAGVAPIFPARGDDPLTLTVRSADGMVVWTKDYRAGNPALGSVRIAVALTGPGAVSAAERVPLGNKRLRGQILDLTRTATLKDALVAVQVKAMGDTAWRIVGSAASDAGGNFSMAYPLGAFAAAQAVVSLMPDTPVAIPVHADTGDGHTVSDDFLYLLLTLPAKPAVPATTDPAKPGCECADPRASRLPDQTDLIRSGEYMQDLGNGCLSLSTPNRTLREYSYTAIVRTSDPDVANYTLTKDASGGFALAGGDRLIRRRAVSLTNPVRWQDAPDAHASLNFYQTVSVATGHVLHYRSQFRADGYSLGDLLYSLPLAPGQKKQIATFDARHSLTGSESQTISVSERLAANLVNDRSVADQLGGSVGEGMKGSSNAHTEGMSMGLGGAASMGSMGASLGIAGGFSNANSVAAQDSSRVISQFFAEKLKVGLAQNAESYRAQNATAVTTVAEGQGFSATTEVVANHNHCHSLTMMYFEVLRHYAVYQELVDVEECVFVPLLMTNFTTENIYKWQDVLAANLLPLAANTYLPSVKGQHPLAPAFDAVARRKINYEGLDFPDGTYASEVMQFIDGTLQVTVEIPRPKTKYDRILSLPLVNKTISHQEVDPIQTAKNIAIAPFTFGLSMAGGPAMKTVTETIEVRAAIFDAFMTMEPDFASVPPAQSIRVTNFDDVYVPISPLYFAALGVANPQTTLAFPKDRFFDDNELDRRQWTAYATLMGYTDVHKFLGTYFKGKLISEWDTIFYRDIAPVLFEHIVDSLIFSTTPPGKTTTPAGPTPADSYKGITADFATTARYTGGVMRMTLTLRGTSSIKREDLPRTLYLQAGGAVAALGDVVTLRLEDMTLHYTTAHCTNVLFSGHLGDDLQDGTLLYLPPTSEDLRYPRHEDAVLAAKLIEHLNSNLEHYNKALWTNLDPDRRYLLLDGFNIQVYNDFGAPLGLKSLASVVKNELLAVAGNALVIPVAAGMKVAKSYVVEATETGAPAKVSLLDHYKPHDATPPYRLSVPTRGIYAEAMMGQCNSCEKVEEGTSQDWTRFQTDTPSAINAITPPTATVTDWKATFKDLAAATVGMQKAPDLPAVGAGTAGMTTALTTAGAFKDITGLDKNQSNAIETYKANNATVEKMAAAASALATMEHNTANAAKIKEGLDKSKAEGAITPAEHADLTKQHHDQVIDGGAAAKRKEEAAAKAAKAATAKPSLKDAAVGSVGANKHVIATKVKRKGGSDTVEIKPTGDTSPMTPAPAPDDGSTPPVKPRFYKTIFFKATDCYGDPFQATFSVTVTDGGTGDEIGYEQFEFGSGNFRVPFSAAAPSVKVKVAALYQPDAINPINTNFHIDSEALPFPATQAAINVNLVQRGTKIMVATKDSTLTGQKVTDETSKETTRTDAQKNASSLSAGTGAAGTTVGGKFDFETNSSVADKAASRHATEVSTGTGHDDGKTFEVLLPTNYYDLFVK